MKDYRVISIIIIIAGVIGVAIILAYIPSEHKSLVNTVSIVGTFASVIGLIIAFLQILSIKITAEHTQNEVKKSIHRLNTVLSIADLSKTKKLIDEIQILLQHDDFNGALFRLKDLKEVLIQTKFNQDLSIYTNNKKYSTLIVNIGISINIINDFILKNKVTISTSTIIETLEVTKEKLIELESELKIKQP